MLKSLLTKQLQEDFRFLKQDKKDIDWWGAVFSLLLTTLVIGVIVLVYVDFLDMYQTIKVSGEIDKNQRIYEVLTFTYGVILIISILSGARAIRVHIFDSGDIELYKILPIAPLPMFISKLVTIYIRQVLTSIMLIIPINITIGVYVGPSASFILATIFSCFYLPLVTMLFSILIAFPSYVIRKIIGNRYVVSMVIITIVTGLVFWGYSELIEFFKGLVENGNIKYLFNQDLMLKIINITNNLYPANVFSSLLMGRNIGVNVGILIGSIIGFSALAIPLMAYSLKFSMKYTSGNYVKPIAVQHKTIVKKRSLVTSLFEKELFSVLRTPSYMFAYFTLPIVMPIMVYFCVSMSADLISTVAMINCNLELSISIIFIFVVLCNVFAATNISREGLAFYTMKVMPISFRTIIGVKIGFSSIISNIGIIVSVIVIGATGYITAAQAIYVLIAAVIFSESQIIFATRHDFNYPNFMSQDVTESSSTASALVILGVIIAVLLGVSSILFSIYGGLLNGLNYVAFTYSICMIVPLLLFGLSLAYLYVGLDKKYEMISESL